MKRIRIKIDTVDNIISLKYGRFGEWVQYSGGWFNAYSLQDVINHFTQTQIK